MGVTTVEVRLLDPDNLTVENTTDLYPYKFQDDDITKLFFEPYTMYLFAFGKWVNPCLNFSRYRYVCLQPGAHRQATLVDIGGFRGTQRGHAPPQDYKCCLLLCTVLVFVYFNWLIAEYSLKFTRLLS